MTTAVQSNSHISKHEHYRPSTLLNHVQWVVANLCTKKSDIIGLCRCAMPPIAVGVPSFLPYQVVEPPHLEEIIGHTVIIAVDAVLHEYKCV